MKNKTDITMVVDISGSMQYCAGSATEGINAFVAKQKEIEGECVYSLVEFDDRYTLVHDGIDISRVPAYKLMPVGGTALYDAIGKTINAVGARLSRLQEKDRPDKVLIVIMTDGGENASKEFTEAQIARMTKHQTDTYNWQFLYLGANQDGVAVGNSLGIQNSYRYEVAKYGSATDAVSASVTRMRSGECRTMNFTDEEKNSIV